MTRAGNKLTIQSVLWRCVLSHSAIRPATKPGTRPATKKAQREASVDNLLGAALRLFVSQGFRHTTVENIADVARLTKGSVYFYFDTKAALLGSLLDQVEEIVVGEMEARVDNLLRANASPGEKITAFVHGQARLGVERWEYVLLLILMSLEFAGRGDEIERRTKAIYRRLYRTLESIIEDGKATGEFRADISTREQAAIVMAGHDGTFLEWYRRADTLDGEELVRALRTTTLAGLAAPSAEAGVKV